MSVRLVLGARISAARRALDITQSDLADKIGVGANQVSRWERGQAMPGPRHLGPLAEALQMDRDELFVLAIEAGAEETSEAHRVIAEVAVNQSAMAIHQQTMAEQLHEVIKVTLRERHQMDELHAMLVEQQAVNRRHEIRFDGIIGVLERITEAFDKLDLPPVTDP